MILFVAGFSAEADAAAEDALRALVERLPFFPGRAVETWASGRAAVAWVSHDVEQTGGVRYVAADANRIALFAGRPFRWLDEARADGASAIDARAYLDGARAETLDGRFVVLRCSDAGMEVVPDALGAYPVYTAAASGTTWVSNNAELLRSIADDREMSTRALASVLGGGWSLDGDPLWEAVRRLAPGGVHTFAAGGHVHSPPPEPAAERFDAERSAALLRAATTALAQWPGRPSVVPITAGRDSRLVLAAALAAGLEVSTLTGGVPGARDVEVGARLAAAAGLPHALIPDDPAGTMPRDWRRQARLLELAAAGTATLADAAGFPFGPRPGPLPLWHSGQGGEVARAYYGLAGDTSTDDLAERLYRSFVGRRPGRRELLSHAGAELVREQIRSFVDTSLSSGAETADLLDRFYLERRMGTWAGPTHGCVEYVRDTTSPLWSRRLIPQMLGLPPAQRAAERFHSEVLAALAPQLLAVPYEDGTLPGQRQRARSARALAGKLLAAGRRRLPQRPDLFAPVLPEIRDVVLSQPSHPAWEVLDRARAEQLLIAAPGALDTMSRYYVWRLATVFTISAARTGSA